jgi:hypothetical protein
VAQFESLKDTLDRWRVAIQNKTDKHDKTLYGNGEPGMDENIREILKYIVEQKEEKKKRRETWGKIQIPVTISGILFAVGFFYDIYRHINP